MPTGDVVSSLCPRSPYGFAPQRPCPARGGQKKGPHARRRNGIIYEGPYSHGHAVGPCQSDAWVGMGGRNKRATCPPPQQHLPMGPTWAAPRCSSTVPSCTRSDASATWRRCRLRRSASKPSRTGMGWLFVSLVGTPASPAPAASCLPLLPPAAPAANRSCRMPLLPPAAPTASRSRRCSSSCRCPALVAGPAPSPACVLVGRSRGPSPRLPPSRSPACVLVGHKRKLARSPPSLEQGQETNICLQSDALMTGDFCSYSACLAIANLNRIPGWLAQIGSATKRCHAFETAKQGTHAKT